MCGLLHRLMHAGHIHLVLRSMRLFEGGALHIIILRWIDPVFKNQNQLLQQRHWVYTAVNVHKCTEIDIQLKTRKRKLVKHEHKLRCNNCNYYI